MAIAGALRAHRRLRWRPRPAVLAVIGFGLAGLALRAAFLALPTGALDSDEAVVGLMALHALHHGELTAFFWGQSYGGSLEAMALVPVFALLGPSTLTLKLMSTVLWAAAAVLVWRLGRRTVGERAGLVAALAIWVWPANLVWLSTKARLFYFSTVVLGLALLVVAARLGHGARGHRWWLAVGLLAGLGWWTTPQSLFFTVPAVGWVAVTRRREVWRLVLAAPAAAVGAAPWLAHNFANDWASITERGYGQVFDRGPVGNFGVLVGEGLPVLLGLHSTGRWLVPYLFPLLYAAVAVAVAVAVARRPRGTGLLVLFAATFPAIYVWFPVSGVVGEGRYVVFALPVAALLIAHAAGRPAVQAAFLAGALALSIATVPVLADATSPRAVDVGVPADHDPLLRDLDERGVDRVVSDYWLAYRIVFETGREVLATPYTDSRYPPYEDAIAGGARLPVWVFIEGTAMLVHFEAALAARGVASRRWQVDRFIVHQPARAVGCWPPPDGFDCG